MRRTKWLNTIINSKRTIYNQSENAIRNECDRNNAIIIVVQNHDLNYYKIITTPSAGTGLAN